ncbi:CCA tRNA nucleotidyltransferase [Amnibacterium setariae]|uniref:CCA tRNA nucleotidyltransferase n=1 Tax=Amnibacterium setariae TaxID=2306585 RepID=A0A3A1TZG6_9MICO|nr:CCA tRNA nucleotidyltransferase [Amnibacterium setariae]RIX30095.1 CCA tRNA nucleotidyltransferase [Amnibacterium setariae]
MHPVAAAVPRLTALAERESVRRVVDAFTAAGHEIALVGGPVRDALLDRPVTDLDLTTSARPDESAAILKPVASAMWDVGRAFGTVAARVAGDSVEVTTYRQDAYTPSSRKPEVVFGDTLDGDLRRRDFTSNAIAVRLPSLAIVDPSDGIAAILDRRLTTPSPAVESFDEDPLRMLRAARFTAQLGFVLDDEGVRAMTALAPRIEVVSAERVREELVKLVSTDRPGHGLELLVDTGLADLVLPELPALRLTSDGEHRHKDVYQHSLQVLQQAIDLEHERFPGAVPDVVLRFAALLHDIGKPSTRRFEQGGVVTFHHHDVVGAKMARKRLKALRFPNAEVDRIAKLIELHQRFFGYGEGAWTDSAVRRYVRDAGDLLPQLHILTRADVTTRNERKARRLAAAYDELEERIERLQEQEELDSIRPDLDGEAIMRELGLRPGPDVGAAYRYLLDVRMEEGPLGEEEAVRRLRAWWEQRQA